jgi:hypothetical protein
MNGTGFYRFRSGIGRYKVYAPSTLHSLHHLSGTKVLAHIKQDDPMCTIYFLEGSTISMRIRKGFLNEGW